METIALAAGTKLSAHDLVWIADPLVFARDNVLPDWASDDWLTRAPLVVRRASRANHERIPVGLRGLARSQREALWLPRAQIRAVITPVMIARQEPWHQLVPRDTLPALDTLARLAPRLDACGLEWGVTGGVGFALASGLGVLHDGSDLDLVVKAPTPLAAVVERQLADLLDSQRARVDMQVETPLGAFALRERSRTGGRVLLKTDDGPVITSSPWGDDTDATTLAT